MAITPLTAPWKMFTFDGVTSGSLGVAILGDGAFNAPERDVEMVAIPGRNGDYILDKGRYMNIEITYPCTLVADSVADFPQAMADLRSLLCSKTTYCRLEDDYNPNEYRMAMYKSGLEVDPMVLKAGTFDITFECKPQRFLKSGETAVSVTSGDDITNPTLFDARPLLGIYGEGSLSIGEGIIVVHNQPVGNVVLFSGEIYEHITSKVIQVDTRFANAGDAITVDTGCNAHYYLTLPTMTGIAQSTSGDGHGYSVMAYNGAYLGCTMNRADFEYGTAKTVTVTGTFTLTTSSYGTLTATVSITLAYDGADEFTLSSSYTVPTQATMDIVTFDFRSITLASTKSALGNPMYIDLDLGEAYNTDYGAVVSTNNAVSLPAVLPTLPSGDTEITYDNTITQLDIVPRWWRV